MSERVWGAADFLPLVRPSYLEDGVTLRSWLLSTDHKRIALLYMVSITLFFFRSASACAEYLPTSVSPRKSVAKELSD